MEYALDDIQNISIDGASRSSRWKALRGYLKQIIKIADENSDRLSSLENEASRLRESNLKLTEAVQVLSDLANEEVQREISLTLNDTDYDIVMDTPEPTPRFRTLLLHRATQLLHHPKLSREKMPTRSMNLWKC